jgi:16S rRNA processing protein RimM
MYTEVIMAKRKYIECGKIINTHGCHGGLKLESWCNTPYELAELKRVFVAENDNFIEKKIKKASVFKQFVIAELLGITDMDTAMALKNTVIYASRDDFDLSEGEYFIADMIGLDVIDAQNGKHYGKVTDIVNRGASDIYVVDTENGERMIPAVDEFIVKADVNEGIFVNVIPGLLD